MGVRIVGVAMAVRSSKRRVSDRGDTSWEPNEVLLKVYVTRSFSTALAAFSRELSLSKSMLLREAVRRGLPALVNDVRFLESQGYRPSTHLAGAVAAEPSRGRLGEGVASGRWSKTPGVADRVPAESPPVKEIEK